MSTDASNELSDFAQFVTDVVRKGPPWPTPEEALDAFREVHPLSDDELAIEEALDSLDAGERGMPLDDYLEQFRKRNGLPAGQ